MEKDSSPESSVNYHNILSSWDTLTDLDTYMGVVMRAYSEGDHESCMQALTELEEQLHDGDFFGEDCLVSGKLCRLDEDDNTLRPWDIENVQSMRLRYDGLQIVLIEDEPTIVFAFADMYHGVVSADQAEESGCTFVAAREDLTQLFVNEGKYDEVIDMQDMLRTHHEAVETLMRTEDYVRASTADRMELLHEKLADISEKLTGFWSDVPVSVQADIFYRIRKDTTDPINWREAKVSQGRLDDDKRVDINGIFKGVVVPADHPACERRSMSRNESRIWLSPHAIFDGETVAMVPLQSITYVEIHR